VAAEAVVERSLAPDGREAALRAFALACGMRIRAGEEDGTGLA
jgi:hypothetical protein